MIKNLCILAFFSLMTIVGSLSAVVQDNYEAKDIGTLQTYESRPIAINNQGQIFGWYRLSGPMNEVTFFVRNREGDFNVIPNTFNGFSIEWQSLSEEGNVYGIHYGAYRNFFMWNRIDGVVNLGILPEGQIVKINNAGQVLIHSIHRENGKVEFYPVVWHNGNTTKLQGLVGDLGLLAEESYADDINNHGDVVGYSIIPIVYKNNIFKMVQRAVLWSNGSVIDLHKKLPKECQKYPISTSRAFAINDFGEIFVSSSDGGQVVIKNDGEYIGVSSRVNGINTNLIKYDNDFWMFINNVVDMNENGEAVGVGRTIYGEQHAMLFVPVKPEPK